jgi:hypothetical protein
MQNNCGVLLTPDLPFPTMEPPKQYNHCIGWYERNAGGKIYWRSRIPRNLKFIASHWTDRILPDGTTFLGRYPDGQPSFGPPIHTDHTRKAPEASGKAPESTKKVDQIPPTQQSDPVIPGSDPVTQPPRQATNNSNLRPGTYTPGGTPKVLAFHDQVEYKEIPSRHDYDYHYDDNTIDESNAVNEDTDPYQASTVVPLMTRMKYAPFPSAHWVPQSVQGSKPGRASVQLED